MADSVSPCAYCEEQGDYKKDIINDTLSRRLKTLIHMHLPAFTNLQNIPDKKKGGGIDKIIVPCKARDTCRFSVQVESPICIPPPFPPQKNRKN